MTTSTSHARHRAARRPVTTLTSLAQAAGGQMSTVGRRTAVVAASSGLIVSMIGVAAPAQAATNDNGNGLNSVDVSGLSASTRAAVEAAPAVTVSSTAKISVDSAPLVVTPAPKAEVKKVARAANTSRTEARTAQSSTPARSAQTKVSIPASANGSAIISIAARYQGVPYVYGGSTPSGFDCSGFVSYVYAQVGISLPHSSSAIGAMGTKVSRAQAQPGDIIWTPGHVAIYAGGNQMIDAPRPGGTIQFRSMYQSNPTFIRIG